ncbi:hypothetical protein GCM10027280_06070 [Micromonospora polyrhachis]|uniref:Ig-like domain-containing protein n=1 Tax=Micromonospora polyrhachis TaxID=1282883 RepID=A0A7W7SKN5_9ACTN|nr:hypothetical protein [Micromonospora polyrhachis]MBB4956484.1 hypothetical protein [Micromonospora polyrhachis]
MRRTLRATVATAVAAGLLSVWPAVTQADSGSVTRVTLASARNVTPGALTLLTSRTVTLATGESRHVKGRFEATSSMTSIAAMNNHVRCLDSAGSQVGVQGVTSRNHEGSDTTSYAIDGHLPLYADLLFTAPAAGTYTCGVYGYTASSASSSYHLTAVPGSTWLEMSDTNQAGSHWWQNPVCNSTGTSSTCSYIGAGTSTVHVFYNDGTPVYKWTAAPDATAVQSLANLTVTTCYLNTASCQRSSVAPYQKARGTNAVIDARLEVIQLDPTAHTCRNTATATTRHTIRDDAHHYAAYFRLPQVTIDPTCGTRMFIMRIVVTHISGQPVKIDGLQGTSALSHGIAMNLFD